MLNCEENQTKIRSGPASLHNIDRILEKPVYTLYVGVEYVIIKNVIKVNSMVDHRSQRLHKQGTKLPTYGM